jgi:hypothetical protein
MDDFNAGQFSTSFFYLIYTSSVMFRYKDNKVYEGIGYPPDIEVRYDSAAIANGKDLQLEKAIDMFK